MVIESSPLISFAPQQACAKGLNNLFLPLSGIWISGKENNSPVMVMESSPRTDFPAQQALRA